MMWTKMMLKLNRNLIIFQAEKNQQTKFLKLIINILT